MLENDIIKKLPERSGKYHAQTSTTLNIYAHSLKSTDEKAANTIENLLDREKILIL